MIPYDTDPSLHAHDPKEAMLDDGFSPPASDSAQPSLHDGIEPSTAGTQAAGTVFWDKSDF